MILELVSLHPIGEMEIMVMVSDFIPLPKFAYFNPRMEAVSIGEVRAKSLLFHRY